MAAVELSNIINVIRSVPFAGIDGEWSDRDCALLAAVAASLLLHIINIILH
jgi:hypothetical protein